MPKINRYIIAGVCLLLLSFSQNAHASKIDSLKSLLSKQADTVKVKTMIDIGIAYDRLNKYDTALNYYIDALKLAEAIRNKECLFISLMQLANFYEDENNFQLALEFGLRAQKLAEEENNKQQLFEVYNYVGGIIYFNHGDYDTSLAYGMKGMKIAVQINDKQKIVSALTNLGDDYRAFKKFDSAFKKYSDALNVAKEINAKSNIIELYNDIAFIYDAQEKFRAAIPWFSQAIAEAQKDGIKIPVMYDNIANGYLEINNYDSALFFEKKLLDIATSRNILEFRLLSYRRLSRIYEAKKIYTEAFSYLNAYAKLKDSMNATGELNKVDLLESEYKTDKQKREIELLQKNSDLQTWLRNVLIATAIPLLVTAFLIANKYNHKKRSELALAVKNDELNHTLTNLKAAQSQLIQSEKMASLGELTAGIAHEIQNPLNFVNNFSEVSNELMEELQGERLKVGGERDMAVEDEILNDIKQNLEKINHHGKRADAIVKGMLQHSRKSTGAKEPTDINALADEYLRLAYQGLRAKDKNFNATLNTHFDTAIGKINIIPQDIGRVLLNMFNNAFYAVTERLKMEGEGYKPEVTVSTLLIKPPIGGMGVSITISDNGIGISQSVINKIFQPFFTTKPTGQGTGLGLSLSYDIIKAHGGEITVETREGEGATFIITLPA